MRGGLELKTWHNCSKGTRKSASPRTYLFASVYFASSGFTFCPPASHSMSNQCSSVIKRTSQVFHYPSFFLVVVQKIAIKLLIRRELLYCCLLPVTGPWLCTIDVRVCNTRYRYCRLSAHGTQTHAHTHAHTPCSISEKKDLP